MMPKMQFSDQALSYAVRVLTHPTNAWLLRRCWDCDTYIMLREAYRTLATEFEGGSITCCQSCSLKRYEAQK